MSLHDANSKSQRLKLKQDFDTEVKGKEDNFKTQLKSIESKLDSCRTSMLQVNKKQRQS